MKDDIFSKLFNGYESEQFADETKWKLFPRSCGRNELNVKHLVRLMQPTKLLFHRLSPTTKDAARTNTLSSRFGLGEFPLHTDFASVTVPPKYILLVAPRPRDTETLLFDARRLIEQYGHDYLSRCLFLLHGTTPRYCRMLTLKDGRLCFRYNKAVMTPQNPEAQEVANYINSGGLPLCRINWHQHRVALIDNWGTFHSRSTYKDPDRIGLYRFAIWKE